MSAHWHILGAGSIGLLWAAHLVKAGHQVTLLTQHQPPYPQKIQCDQQSYTINIQANNAASPIEHLLITTKTWQTLDAVNAIRRAIQPQTSIVLLQNGMANHQWLLEQFPSNPVYAAITTEGALRQQAWQVKHTGFGVTTLGAMNAHCAQRPHFLDCDLNLQHSDNIQTALWQKLVMNCCINPLTALHDCLNGELLNNPQALEQIAQIRLECCRVATQLGFAEALQNIEPMLIEVMQKTAQNSSSMREDFRQGKPTEIDAINGYIVQQGQKLGIATPVNQLLVQTIKGQTP